MPQSSHPPTYPNFPDLDSAVRYIMKGLTDHHDAIAALNTKQTTHNATVTQVIEQQRTIQGQLPLSIAAVPGYFLDSYDANTGLFTSSAGSAPNFADDETLGGSGTAWTLANTPNPVASMILVYFLAGYGGIPLDRNSVDVYGYTVSGTNVTTVSSYGAGTLKTWYRY